MDLQRLTGELQQSRTQLVSAREEERRRLRRDLHDGLGPQLASLTLKLETARNKLAHDPLADRLLANLTAQTQTAVADIRRLVYALRPPALDELGLLSALQEQALQYSQQGQSPLLITCQAPESLPPLPAAVEVAVYRIAQEALTNVVRHAQADQCHLRLVLDAEAGILSLEIQDNGCGLSPTHHRGVGLTSMRERAEELGGTWVIEAAATGGTRILVRFPFLPLEGGDSPDHRRLSLTAEEEDES
jgi:signal transduction histidine kinase